MLRRKLSSLLAAPLLSVLALLMLPSTAWAGLEAGPIEIGMYGRMGAAWNPANGQYVHGRSMNLFNNGPLGGRLEEGDYLEPTIKLHIMRPTADDNTKPWFQFVITPSMFSSRGSFLGAFANNFSSQLQIELFQAYLETGNVLVPDLTLWAGQRFYRGSDVHIADYFFFNQLNAQGFGAKYKGLDVAVLLQTSLNNPQYAFQTDADADFDAQRQRTVFVGQYVLPVMEKHSLHFLGEFHLLPPARAQADTATVLPRDIGYVAGIKGRMDLSAALGEGSFNELAVRYGGGIANGAFGASPTWGTRFAPNEDGKYNGALGLEVVDHFLYNVNSLLSLNAYGILQFSKGASGADEDQGTNFATGVRSFLYLHDQFHLINELSFQGVMPGVPEGAEAQTPTAVKFSIVPTIVPSGQRSPWARPHLRLIYTFALYNEAALDNLYSGYLQAFGRRAGNHYLGARAEWWF